MKKFKRIIPDENIYKKTGKPIVVVGRLGYCYLWQQNDDAVT